MFSEKEKRTSEYWYIFLAILLALFCIMKVFRGIDVTSTQEGGLWNYISLVYYGVFFWGAFTIRRFRIQTGFVALLLYSVFSMLFSLISSSLTSLYSIYSYLMIPYAFLVLSSFYMFSMQSKKADSLIVLTYMVCLGLNLFSIVRFLFFGGNRAAASDVYYSLCLFPFALIFVKNAKLKTALIWIQFFVIFLGNKRAGFIAFIVGIVLYYIIEEYIKEKSDLARRLGKILAIAIAMLLLFALSRYVDALFGIGIYDRLAKLETDGGSGRETLYSAVWNAFKDSSLLEKLTGHGLKTAGAVGGAGYAHNDFLEALYDFGIPSVLCLIVFYLALIAEAIRMIVRKSPYASAFAFSLVVGVMLSMFSYFLVYFTYITCVAAFWGCVLKKERERERNEWAIIVTSDSK